jgi:hypothetical protein
VSTNLHSVKGLPAGPFVSFFAECSWRHSAKLASLPSARATTLGKEALSVLRCCFSAECYGLDTWQSTSLPSVTLGKVTSIHLFNLFLLFHPNKQNISHIRCRRFETGGSLSRRVNVPRASAQMGRARGRARRGESEVAGDRRERGGNLAAFVFVPRAGRVRLQ